MSLKEKKIIMAMAMAVFMTTEKTKFQYKGQGRSFKYEIFLKH